MTRQPSIGTLAGIQKWISKCKLLLLAHPAYHIFGIAESRLGPGVGDDCVQIDGYSIIRQDRNTQGGGVMLYVHNTCKAKVLCTSSTTQVTGKQLVPEYIMCSVQHESSPSCS